MTGMDNWEQQSGGLYLTVKRFDAQDKSQHDVAAKLIQHIVQTVSRAHNAPYEEESFRKNVGAVYTGDLKLDLYLAKWEVCGTEPACVGATLGWDTYGITPAGELVHAFYTEDTCLMNAALRQLIRGKPPEKNFPKESLAECFERLALARMRARNVTYQFGEVNPDNTAMIRQLKNNGAVIGNPTDSAVLEIKLLPDNPADRPRLDVEVVLLQKNGVTDNNNFIVRWQDGQSDVRCIVTKGMSTAMGKVRTDIRPWHNGILPEQPILEGVLSSALLAIKLETENRGWGYQADRPALSTNITPTLPKQET